MEMDRQAAVALLEKERAERIARCEQAIREALERENCLLDVQVILRAGQIIPQVTIVTRD